MLYGIAWRNSMYVSRLIARSIDIDRANRICASNSEYHACTHACMHTRRERALKRTNALMIERLQKVLTILIEGPPSGLASKPIGLLSVVILRVLAYVAPASNWLTISCVDNLGLRSSSSWWCKLCLVQFIDHDRHDSTAFWIINLHDWMRLTHHAPWSSAWCTSTINWHAIVAVRTITYCRDEKQM
jgi:hypothetical protein